MSCVYDTAFAIQGQVRYVGLTSLYMAVMMSDGLDVVTVELELE